MDICLIIKILSLLELSLRILHPPGQGFVVGKRMMRPSELEVCGSILGGSCVCINFFLIHVAIAPNEELAEGGSPQTHAKRGTVREWVASKTRIKEHWQRVGIVKFPENGVLTQGGRGIECASLVSFDVIGHKELLMMSKKFSLRLTHACGIAQTSYQTHSLVDEAGLKGLKSI